MKIKGLIKALFISMLFTALLVCSTGCSQQKGGKETSNSTQSKSSTNQEHPKLLKMGEKATADDYEVAILSAKTATEYAKGPGDGYKYVVIRCSFKNISKENKSTSIGSSLQWLGADGRRNGYESFTGVKTIEAKRTLAPGEAGEYEEVYKVPKDKNEIEFHYVTMKPIELARWQVTIN